MYTCIVQLHQSKSRNTHVQSLNSQTYAFGELVHRLFLNLTLMYVVFILKLLYLVVLIRGNRDEGCLMEDMSAVGSVLGSKGVVFICFDYV